MGWNLRPSGNFRLLRGQGGTHFVFGDVFFGFQRRHAAGSGGGDGLAENFVLHIAGGEHAGTEVRVLPGAVRM